MQRAIRQRSLALQGNIIYAFKLVLTTGDVLYSNDSRPMFTIGQDTVGRHDFLLTPCSLEMFTSCIGMSATIQAASRT
ncbi:DUF1989 domain-containing protein [Roseateles agri]|uniref:DUF1989 domain-containing protein n=1 Tax=Roseateles agri TaxID=3098619 RepID=UPI003D66A15C